MQRPRVAVPPPGRLSVFGADSAVKRIVNSVLTAKKTPPERGQGGRATEHQQRHSGRVAGALTIRYVPERRSSDYAESRSKIGFRL